MGSAFIKDILREIGRSRSRFFSIFAIIALGAGFFAGLKATAPSMLKTMDNYYAEQNLMDIRLVSTYGFNDNDIKAIKDTDGIKSVYPTYSKDVFVINDENLSVIAKLKALPDETTAEYADKTINSPVLIEGRYPKSPDECLVEKHGQLIVSFDIGDTVSVYTTDPDDTMEDSLIRDSWTVVGIVMYPQYISYDRGSAPIGNGSVDTFILIPESNFIYDVYNEVYLTFLSTEGISAFDDAYSEVVGGEKEKFEALAKIREEERYIEIQNEADEKISDAKKELADAEKEADEELADAEKELADAYDELIDAEKEIKDGWKEYYDGVKEYEDGKAEFEEEIAKAENEILSAEWELNSGQSQYKNGKKEYSDGLKQFNDGLAEMGMTVEELYSSRAQIKSGIEQCRSAIAKAEAAISMLENYGMTGTPEYSEAVSGLAQANATKKALEDNLKEVNEALDAYDELQDAEDELDDAGAEINKGKKELKKGKKELEKAKADGEKELKDAEKELNDARIELLDAEQELADGWEEYYDGVKEYEDGKKEAEEKIADARQKIADAEEEVADIKKPVWYVLTRDDNPGYSTFEGDAERIDGVGRVFPVFFFMVAMLVCLTTMTSMVEEERTQIGTMKALGYSHRSIAAKFIVYSSAASFLGSILGIAVGVLLFPKVIYSAYEMMYKTPKLMFKAMPGFWVAEAIVCIACTTLAVFMACISELRSNPASLMRPKAPKAGKRVLLEKIPFIWKRFSFTKKVTIRNLFRYKKRIFMTVIGIAGCTALTLTGFGLLSSISVILDKQYEEIFNYDLIVALDTEEETEKTKEVMAALDKSNISKENLAVYMKSAEYRGMGDITLVVTDDKEKLDYFIKLKNRVTGEAYGLSDDGIIVTERFSEVTGLSAGDEMTFTCGDEQFTVNIDAVAENYTMHFFFMSENLYEKLCGKAPEHNSVFTKMSDDGETAQSELASELIGYDGVMALSFVRDTKEAFGNTVGNLNYVVILVIASAAMLAFIVLYNLTNINITERIREIATIKVLGFYDGEVSSYVFRENVLLTVMGGAVGLALGIWFHGFVMDVAQTDSVMFGRGIPIWCFASAFAMTILFAFMVNFIMYFRLKKVSMVESLKSVE